MEWILGCCRENGVEREVLSLGFAAKRPGWVMESV